MAKRKGNRQEPASTETANETLKPQTPPPRRSLAEMAADGIPGGIVCPRCGCAHSAVVHTWDIDGARRRKRVCRHCGEQFPTTER